LLKIILSFIDVLRFVHLSVATSALEELQPHLTHAASFAEMGSLYLQDQIPLLLTVMTETQGVEMAVTATAELSSATLAQEAHSSQEMCARRSVGMALTLRSTLVKMETLTVEMDAALLVKLNLGTFAQVAQ
jgi:hypothetical protein